jgi:hypothetical protein
LKKLVVLNPRDIRQFLEKRVKKSWTWSRRSGWLREGRTVTPYGQPKNRDIYIYRKEA